MSRKRAQRKKDGGKVLMRSFEEMCDRLDFMNTVLTENRKHIRPDHIRYVIHNAFAIEQEWVLDPLQRSYGNGGDPDDYTESMYDA
jgi:hypothetical protein